MKGAVVRDEDMGHISVKSGGVVYQVKIKIEGYRNVFKIK